MRFRDIGCWKLGRLGLVGSRRMNGFLQRLLRTCRFEEMPIPLGVATGLATGMPVDFSGPGPVFAAIRASCSCPGLFQPVRSNGGLLVDGAISQEIPAALARRLGATHVVSVYLPAPEPRDQPTNVFHVVNRCFQILQSRAEASWRSESDLVIAPGVGAVEWDGFSHGARLIKAGEAAASSACLRFKSGSAAPAWFPCWPTRRSLTSASPAVE